MSFTTDAANLALEIEGLGESADSQLALANSHVTSLQQQVAALQLQLPVHPVVRLDHAVGIYTDGGAAGVKNFEAWLGKPVDLVHTYANPFKVGQAAPSGWGSYAGKMLLSVDILAGDSMANVAKGSRYQAFQDYAKKLVAAGMGSAVIRAGWELTGDWMTWSTPAKNTKANWLAAFGNFVAAFRSVPNQNFMFEANIAALKPWDVSLYPDEADIWGADTYAGYNKAPSTYNKQSDLADWLGKWQAAAKTAGKQVAISEWGVWNKTDPSYIRFMASLFKTWDNLAYQVYFDKTAGTGHDGIEHGLATYVDTGAEYKAAFGKVS